MNLEESVKNILASMTQDAVDYWCMVEGVLSMPKYRFEKYFADYSIEGLASLLTASTMAESLIKRMKTKDVLLSVSVDDLVKAKEIKGRPGYKLQAVKVRTSSGTATSHRWVKVEDVGGEFDPEFRVDKDTLKQIIKSKVKGNLDIYRVTGSWGTEIADKRSKITKSIYKEVFDVKDETKLFVSGYQVYGRWKSWADTEEALLFRLAVGRMMGQEDKALDEIKDVMNHSWTNEYRSTMSYDEYESRKLKDMHDAYDLLFDNFSKTLKLNAVIAQEAVRYAKSYDKGTDSIMVYRSVTPRLAKDMKEGDDLEIDNGILSSWTLDKKVADNRNFSRGGAVISMRIPVSAVLFADRANPHSSSGLTDEDEIVFYQPHQNVHVERLDPWDADYYSVKKEHEIFKKSPFGSTHKIANAPGYYFDKQAHRWKKIAIPESQLKDPKSGLKFGLQEGKLEEWTATQRLQLVQRTEDLDLLGKMAHDPDASVRRAIVNRLIYLNAPQEELKPFTKDPDFYVRMNLAERLTNQDVLHLMIHDDSADVRSRIARRIDEDGLRMLMKDPNEDVRVNVVMRANDDILHEMIHDGRPLIRQNIAKLIGVEYLDDMINDDNRSVREEVAKRIGQDGLRKMIDDEDIYVRVAVAQRIDDDGLRLMINDENQAVRAMVAEKADQGDLRKLMHDDDIGVRVAVARRIDEDGLREMIKGEATGSVLRTMIPRLKDDQKTLHDLLHSPSCQDDSNTRELLVNYLDQSGLHEMVNDPDSFIREEVANKIDMEGLHEMVTDVDESVRKNVAARIDNEGLHKLINDKRYGIRLNVAKRIDQDGLRKLMHDSEGSVRQEVARHIDQAGLREMITAEFVKGHGKDGRNTFVLRAIASRADQKGLDKMLDLILSTDDLYTIDSCGDVVVRRLNRAGLQKVMDAEDKESYFTYVKRQAKRRIGYIDSINESNIKSFSKTGKIDVNKMDPKFRETIAHVDGDTVQASESYDVLDELFSDYTFHNELRDGWLDSANDEAAAILKDSAARLYGGRVRHHDGLDKEADQVAEEEWQNAVKNAYGVIGISREQTDDYVKKMKSLTRQMLDIRFPGTDTITLYRGTSLHEAELEGEEAEKPYYDIKEGVIKDLPAKVKQNSLSSWSYRYDTARKFGDAVIKITVPKDDVWCSFLNYSHSGWEGEMIVLGTAEPREGVLNPSEGLS